MPDAAPTTPTRREPATAPPPAAPADDIDLFCPGCGYDLRALQGDACPECGQAIDLDKLRASSIPWVLGEGLIGKAWGFVRTVLSVTVRPGRFCKDVSRPIALRPAQWFRRVVVMVAWLSALITARAVWWSYEVWDETRDLTEFIEEELLLTPGWMSAVLAVCGLLFVVGWTGLHLYWLHPRSLAVERQDRAVAMGHYACAPLALMPLAAAIALAGIGLEWAGYEYDMHDLREAGEVLWVLAIFVAAVFVLLFWRNAWVFAGRAAYRSGMGQAGLAIGLPLLWVLWGVLTFVGLPAAAGFVAITVWSW